MTQLKRIPILVLECICGEKFILTGLVAGWRSGNVLLECDCGERFTLFARIAISEPPAASEHKETRRPEEEHCYSWLEGYLESLEGKEARQEYYARLEQAASC